MSLLTHLPKHVAQVEPIRASPECELERQFKCTCNCDPDFYIYFETNVMSALLKSFFI